MFGKVDEEGTKIFVADTVDYTFILPPQLMKKLKEGDGISVTVGGYGMLDMKLRTGTKKDKDPKPCPQGE